MPKIPKKFRPPNGGIKENPAAIISYIISRYEKISKNDVCFRGLRPVFVFFVLPDLRVFLEKAEGRRAVRTRRRSRAVRMRAGRTRVRARVHATASSPNAQTSLCSGVCPEIVDRKSTRLNSSHAR